MIRQSRASHSPLIAWLGRLAKIFHFRQSTFRQTEVPPVSQRSLLTEVALKSIYFPDLHSGMGRILEFPVQAAESPIEGQRAPLSFDTQRRSNTPPRVPDQTAAAMPRVGVR